MYFAKEVIKQPGFPEAEWEPMGDETVDSKVVRIQAPSSRPRTLRSRKSNGRTGAQKYLPGLLTGQAGW